MKTLFFGTILLAWAIPAFAQVEGQSCQADAILQSAPSLVIIVPTPLRRSPAHHGIVRSPAGDVSGDGGSVGMLSGIGSIGTPGIGSIGTSGVGTIDRSGIGSIGRLGIGSIATSGRGVEPITATTLPSAVPMTPVPAAGLRNAVAPALPVAPPLFFTTCR